MLIESGTHGWFNTTVPLSMDRQQFAFAKIGAVPTHDKLGQALIVVPQFDDVQGAHCIASAFGLNWAEEESSPEFFNSSALAILEPSLG
ncbi:hypothetical protein ACQ5SK_19865 [Bradyrhizobium japonicum]